MVEPADRGDRREWPEIDRRRNDQSEQLRHAVTEGIEDFITDREQVRKATHVLIEAVQSEMRDGAGKAVFAGVKRVLWIVIIAMVVLGFAGWGAAVTFVKSMFLR